MSLPKRLGDFSLRKEIGRGGMGRVFLARQISLDRLVAVKVLSAELASHPEFRARFDKEARAAAALIHPNVVQIYVADVEGDIPYFAMEYCDGESLETRLSQARRLPTLEALKIAECVFKTLVAAHDNGVVHRDLKPSNIMIDRFGVVKVLDFGLAKLTMDARMATFTRQGTFLGTPAYVSPEQARGERIDIRSDIYSAGVVLYEMLTGRPPFDGRSTVEILKKQVNESPAPLRELVRDIPESVDHLVLKMLAKDPDDRFASPKIALDAMRDAVAEVQNGQKPATPAPETTRIDFTPDRTEAVFAPVLAMMSATDRAERGKMLMPAKATLELGLGIAAVVCVGSLSSFAYWLLLTRS